MTKATKKILAIGAVVILGILILSACGFTMLVTYQWLTPSRVVVTEKVVNTTDTDVGQSVVVESTDVGTRTANMQTECDYVDGYTSKGLTVPAGTKVFGPAFVKPDRDISWGNPVYVGEEYVTRASDEVVWLLAGDNICVDAQDEYFAFWGKTNPNLDN